MIVPDINLLVYAYNREAREHEKSRRWWEGCLNGSTIIGLPWITAAGFIRLMTHPKVLINPMPVEVAVDQVNQWMNQPSVRILNPGPRFAKLFFEFLKHLGTGGNLVTDAQLAAFSVENQAELHSADSDFSRFSGLRWKNPIRKS